MYRAVLKLKMSCFHCLMGCGMNWVTSGVKQLNLVLYHGNKRNKGLLPCLKSHFGSNSVSDLVDDLGVQAAGVVHVSHHDWEKLNIKSVAFIITFHTQREHKPPTDVMRISFAAAYLRWTHLLRSDVCCTKPVGGVSQGAQQYSVVHL